MSSAPFSNQIKWGQLKDRGWLNWAAVLTETTWVEMCFVASFRVAGVCDHVCWWWMDDVYEVSCSSQISRGRMISLLLPSSVLFNTPLTSFSSIKVGEADSGLQTELMWRNTPSTTSSDSYWSFHSQRSICYFNAFKSFGRIWPLWKDAGVWLVKLPFCRSFISNVTFKRVLETINASFTDTLSCKITRHASSEQTLFD